jgi:dephospho-CoA kinase
VGRLLLENAIPVLDSDQIARNVVAPGSEALEAIVEEMGEEILSPSGTLDRERMGLIVFSDKSKRRMLEKILHPRIQAEQDRWLDDLELKKEVPVAVVDAALMIESGGWKRFDLLVVVDCNESQQVERLKQRNGLDDQAALLRVRAQMPLSDKVKYAARIVNNRGSLEDLKAQVSELASWLRKKAKEKSSCKD